MLYHGDSRELLSTLPEVDAVVTDPPFGLYKTRPHHRGGAWGGSWGPRAELATWDREAVDVNELLTIAPTIVIWGGNYFSLPPSRGWLSWFKPDALPSMADLELAWTNQEMNARQLSWSIAATNGERCGHPTQKPVRVMTWSMAQVGIPEGATVLDPFMGSGTTLVGCVLTGRRCIGIEKERKYFDLAVRRVEQALNSQPLLRLLESQELLAG